MRAFAPSLGPSSVDTYPGADSSSVAKDKGEHMSSDAQVSRGKKTQKGKAPKGKAPERLKCSLLLTRENDLRLTVLASLKGTDRSTLLNTILDDALRGVVVSLRGPLAGESGAGEGTLADAEPEAA